MRKIVSCIAESNILGSLIQNIEKKINTKAEECYDDAIDAVISNTGGNTDKIAKYLGFLPATTQQMTLAQHVLYLILKTLQRNEYPVGDNIRKIVEGEKLNDQSQAVKKNNSILSLNQLELNIPVIEGVIPITNKSGKIEEGASFSIGDYTYLVGFKSGSGSFGTVYDVKIVSYKDKKCHEDIGNKYVAKVINKTPEALKKKIPDLVYSEYNNSKGLDHPNIVKVYQLGEDKENLVIIEECIPGGTLTSDALRDDAYNVFFKQQAEAFVYLQKQGLYHRDYKSDNVMVYYKDNAQLVSKMIDLGFSVRLDLCAFPITENIPCTPELLAQNIQEKKSINSFDDLDRIDSFQLGATLLLAKAGQDGRSLLKQKPQNRYEVAKYHLLYATNKLMDAQFLENEQDIQDYKIIVGLLNGRIRISTLNLEV